MTNKQEITLFERQTIEDEYIIKQLKPYLTQYIQDTKRKIFTLQDRKLKVNNYVGTIATDELNIQILPKIKGQDREVTVAKEILLKLLALQPENQLTTGNAFTGIQEHSILAFFVARFLMELGNKAYLVDWPCGQFTPEGYPPPVKVPKEGFRASIARGPLKRIDWGTLFAQTLDRIQSQFPNTKLADKAAQVARHFGYDVPYVPWTKAQIKSITVGSEDEECKLLITWAKSLLLGWWPNLSSGEYENPALLIDTALLWERGVFHLTEKYIKPEWFHHERKRYGFWGSREQVVDGLVETSDLSHKLVWDTKWMEYKEDKPYIRHLRQILTYEVATGAKHGLLILPTLGDTSIARLEAFKELPNHYAGLFYLSLGNPIEHLEQLGLQLKEGFTKAVALAKERGTSGGY